MAKDYTAIRVSTDAKEAAESAKRDGETWDDYIRRCTENPPEVREFVESGSVPDSSGVDIEGALAELNGGVSYDDVKAACQAAIRDELPDGVFR